MFYIHEALYEGYGVMWPSVRTRIVVALLLYQFTMLVCLSLKLAAAQAAIIAAVVMPATLVFRSVMDSRYNTVIAGVVPLEVFAPVEDESEDVKEGTGQARGERPMGSQHQKGGGCGWP